MCGPESDQKMHMVGHAIDLIRHPSKMTDQPTQIGVQAVLPLVRDQWIAILGRKNQMEMQTRMCRGHRNLLRPCRGDMQKTTSPGASLRFSPGYPPLPLRGLEFYILTPHGREAARQQARLIPETALKVTAETQRVVL